MQRWTPEECNEALVQGLGQCSRCDTPLGDAWAGAHGVAVGVTGRGVRGPNLLCFACASAGDLGLPPGFSLRAWQAQAIDEALAQIWRRGSATIHAAPGAGKTRFTGALINRLKGAGWIERAVIVVPNAALRSQWHEALIELGVHLDPDPNKGWHELPQSDGAVVTYHSLPRAAGHHRQELDRRPTLLVLDEVHHAGDNETWGRAVAKISGDVDGEVHAVGILNLTGTLFRSTGSKRISTVRYRPAEVDPTKFEAIEDFSIRTTDLIPQNLRPPYVYTYGTEVKLLDLSTAEVVEGEIADLDRQQQAAVLRGQHRSDSWVEGFVREALNRLALQQAALCRSPALKLLYVAADQQGAKQAADAINRVANRDFARLVISDEPAAIRTLRKAARDPQPLAIVSVRMVTEGFDCPAVSTIAYASNVLADLTIAQTMARAMRITRAEIDKGEVLPAQILIPDHPKLRAAFAQALVGHMHLIADAATGAPSPAGGSGGGTGLPRYQVIDLTSPTLQSATVLGAADGEVLAPELIDWEKELSRVHVPAVYAAGVAVAARRVAQFPSRIYSVAPEVAEPGRTVADPRTMNNLRRDRAKTLAGWMNGHLDHDQRWTNIAHFQGAANEAAGIPAGGRNMASDEQLAACEAWMAARILEHCDDSGCNPPRMMRAED